MINKNLTSLMAMACSVFSVFGADNLVTIATPGTAMVLNAPQGEDLRLVYFGKNLGEESLGQLMTSRNNINRSVYPAFGAVTGGETSLRVIHSDGNPTTEMKITDVAQTPTSDGSITKVTMTDKYYPLEVEIYYQAYNNSDVIETWTEIINKEKKPVTLTQYDSGTMSFRRGDTWITHLNGGWSSECNMIEEPLDWGMKVLKNKGGNRNGHGDHPEVMISLDGKPQENHGDVIGAVLSWGGQLQDAS